MTRFSSKAARESLLIFIALTVLGAVVFSGISRQPFMKVDDPGYVTNNMMVQLGLSTQSILWAFTTLAYGNWSPLTWISHISDYELFGLDPSGHHIVSLVLHVITGFLLYLAFARISGRQILPFVLAAVFVVHPQHVEPVAWVSSRKDLLSGLFWALSLFGYARYSCRPSALKYVLVLCAMALGLMAKSSLVPLPLIFLLYDITLANRCSAFRFRALCALVIEKIPFILLSVVFAWLTAYAQGELGALDTFPAVTFSRRVMNAAAYVLFYIQGFLWPQHLSTPYPVMMASLGHGLAAILILMLLSLGAIVVSKRQPMVCFGWFFFLVSIFPYLQFIPVGVQSMADRWMYMPLAGLAIVVVWGGNHVFKCVHLSGWARVATGAAWIICLSLVGIYQVSLWKSPEILLRQAVQTYPNNFVAHIWLASYYRDKSEYDKALAESLTAYTIEPRGSTFKGLAETLERMGQSERILDYFRIPDSTDLVFYHLNAASIFLTISLNPRARRLFKNRFGSDPTERVLEHADSVLRVEADNESAFKAKGLAALQQGDKQAALEYLNRAAVLNPNDAGAFHNLGSIYFQLGDLDKSLELLEYSLRLGPRAQDAFLDVAQVLMKQGKLESAILTLERAIRAAPHSYQAHTYLGTVLMMQGNNQQALESFQTAKGLNRDYVPAYGGIGVALFRLGDIEGAAWILEQALSIDPDAAHIHSNLGAALIKLRQYGAAKEHFRRALEIDPSLTSTRDMLAGFKD